MEWLNLATRVGLSISNLSCSSLICGNGNCHLDVTCHKLGVGPRGSTDKEAGAHKAGETDKLCDTVDWPGGRHSAESCGNASLRLHTLRFHGNSTIRLCVHKKMDSGPSLVYVAGGGLLKSLVC